jgi:NADH-quinone oxidoreductase subunit H
VDFNYLLLIILTVFKSIFVIVFVLIAVAYFTVVERKIMGAIQRRKGPNVIGFLGLLQAFADGLKLFAKETTFPNNANPRLFLFSPILVFVLSLVGWSVIPFSSQIVVSDINLGVLFLFAISSLNVYGIVLAGWSSNSKYAYLGALRSAAQMISYEISIGFTMITVILSASSFNLNKIVLAQSNTYFALLLFPIFMIFYISILAETNRHPFDLPEAEAELVSGYNVEYSSMTFALFFLAEYSNMLLMSSLSAILFLGGWISFVSILPGSSFWFSLKILFGVVFFVLTRATLPRYRYDQLMHLNWKSFLPIALGYFLGLVCVLTYQNWLVM